MSKEKARRAGASELVSLTIDGKEVSVPTGTNLINAAKNLGIEIPHFCYHPCLSVVGNCRMCQVEVVGAPKLMIACHTEAQPGMQVKTHHSSETVRAAQEAVLEFILINHPLDCTVCDQSGQCKLQDYYFEYSRRASRFGEVKEHKIKAEPIGPGVMYDGERCILCTRCVRFCDEVTGTSELGVLRRGSRSVVAVNPGRALDNPLSGTVVDLCPVGALTHRKWRFNSRIWFTRQVDTVCPGCSTGCNCRVAVRDGRVVMVKARYHAEVNKEWMCDQGRYGFDRFLPERRVTQPHMSGKPVDWEQALSAWDQAKGKVSLVLLSPCLLLEEYALIKRFIDRVMRGTHLAVAYRERKLSGVEELLISPDFAANFRGAEFVGLLGEDPAGRYEDYLANLKKGVYQAVLIVGDGAIAAEDLQPDLLAALHGCEFSAGMLADAEGGLFAALEVVFPGRSVLEKSGLMINRNKRLQYQGQVVNYPAGSEAEWRIISRMAERNGVRLTQAATYRDLSLEYLESDHRVSSMDLQEIKEGGGVDLRGVWKS